MRKRFLVDTNVLLHDPKSIKAFEDNEVIIPISVLDELDKAKRYPDEMGRNARTIIRQLDKLRSKGSLDKGILLPSGTTVRVELNHRIDLPPGLSPDSIDNRIIRTALGLQAEGSDVTVVTKDINMRVKCDALGIPAQDYERDKLAKTPSSLYTGRETLSVPSADIDRLYETGILGPGFVQGIPNQFFLLQSTERPGHSALARMLADGRLRLVHPHNELWGIEPRNVEQRMAMDLLTDPSISLVTLVGRAGSGKTLLATAAALHYVLNDSPFQRALLSRPIQPMGRDIGYLPGTVDEKLAPWMAALNDNLELLLSSDIKMLDEYKTRGVIQVEPLTYIRGRSIPNSFIILDEAQNLTAQEIKTVITRVGEGSKIVLTGDVEQIDNPYIDFASNGLAHAVERLKGHGSTGHVTLCKGERSELATLASELL